MTIEERLAKAEKMLMDYMFNKKINTVELREHMEAILKLKEEVK